jgi:hypothetical protein
VRWVATLLLGGLVGSAAQARTIGVGVGAVVGEPVGATASFRFHPRFAAQMHAGWRFSQQRAHWNLDGVADLIDIPTDDAMGFTYPVYAGLGLRVLSTSASGRKTAVGLRIPMGVAVIPDASPVEVFFEVTPVAPLAPKGPMGLDAVLGCRVVF